VAEAARDLGLPLEQPESVNAPDLSRLIAEERPEVVCICAFGGLIKEPLLSAHPMLNVHPSLLPRWRGAAPIERAIEAGDPVTGVSIMRPVAELDAGPVCLAAEEPVAPDDDFGSLSARLAALGGELLLRTLEERPPFVEQPPEGATYAPKVEAAERLLAGGEPVAALERRARALNPHVGAYAVLGADERLGVRRARLAPPDLEAPAPGEIAVVGGRLLLGAADGALELIEVQAPGGRPMAAASYLRGRGSRLVGAA
jgi:methionyl-tRNA formyltransferase